METLSPATGSMNGGYVLTIGGKGFPFLEESAFRVNLC